MPHEIGCIFPEKIKTGLRWGVSLKYKGEDWNHLVIRFLGLQGDDRPLLRLVFERHSVPLQPMTLISQGDSHLRV